MAPTTQNPSTAGKGSIGMTTTNNKSMSSFSSSSSPAAGSASTGPISQTAEMKKITGTSDALRNLTMKQLGRLLKSYGMAPRKIDTLNRWDRVYVIRDFSTRAARDGIGDGLERFARGEKMKLREQSSSNSHNTNKRRRLSNNDDHDDHHDEDDHDTKIDEKNFKATAAATDAIATTTTTTTDGTILTVNCTIQTLQSLITGAVETALRQSEHRHAVAIQQALQESEQRHAVALQQALQESEHRSGTAMRDEVFGDRVSDAVHISNNERKIAKYNCESNVATAKYNCESNVATAKYNCESNVAKYNSESNVAKYNSESNVATAKYNSETVTSKSKVACTMMRSDCPVDADTQERVLQMTRLMNTSYSSPNRSQSTQPYQYPPTPLPYPPYMGFLPYTSAKTSNNAGPTNNTTNNASVVTGNGSYNNCSFTVAPAPVPAAAAPSIESASSSSSENLADIEKDVPTTL